MRYICLCVPTRFANFSGKYDRFVFCGIHNPEHWPSAQISKYSNCNDYSYIKQDVAGRAGKTLLCQSRLPPGGKTGLVREIGAIRSHKSCAGPTGPSSQLLRALSRRRCCSVHILGLCINLFRNPARQRNNTLASGCLPTIYQPSSKSRPHSIRCLCVLTGKTNLAAPGAARSSSRLCSPAALVLQTS